MVRRNRKSNSGGMKILAGIGGLAVVLVIIMVAMGGLPFATQPTTVTTAPAQPVDGVIADCAVEDTTLSFVSVDKYNPGTAVSTTAYVSVFNEETNDWGIYQSGVTSASPGDRLSVLLVNGTAPTFHSAFLNGEGITIPCKGTKTIQAEHNDNASLTLSIFNTDGDKVATAGTTNQTVASGGAYNMEFKIDGEDEASSQDLVCVLEGADKTAMDKAILSGMGATPGTLPDFYTLGGASAGTWVYEISPVVGAVTEVGTISVQSKSGQTLAGDSLIVNCYSKEHFVDADGSVVYSVENEDGTAKHIASYTTTVNFS